VLDESGFDGGAPDLGSWEVVFVVEFLSGCFGGVEHGGGDVNAGEAFVFGAEVGYDAVVQLLVAVKGAFAYNKRVARPDL